MRAEGDDDNKRAIAMYVLGNIKLHRPFCVVVDWGGDFVGIDRGVWVGWYFADYGCHLLGEAAIRTRL